MTDFFDIAKSRVEALAVSLQEEDGLSVEQIADSLLALSLTLGTGACGPERTAAVLATLAGKIAADARRAAEPLSPLN